MNRDLLFFCLAGCALGSCVISAHLYLKKIVPTLEDRHGAIVFWEAIWRVNSWKRLGQYHQIAKKRNDPKMSKVFYSVLALNIFAYACFALLLLLALSDY
jgi:hypothetical protein